MENQRSASDVLGIYYLLECVFEFYKVISEQFEFCNESHVTAVALVTMTFQYGGYFVFKVN